MASLQVVPKSFRKHVFSFPGLMEVITTFQQAALSRKAIPNPEENGTTLANYAQNIVLLIVAIVF